MFNWGLLYTLATESQVLIFNITVLMSVVALFVTFVYLRKGARHLGQMNFVGAQYTETPKAAVISFCAFIFFTLFAYIINNSTVFLLGDEQYAIASYDPSSNSGMMFSAITAMLQTIGVWGIYAAGSQIYQASSDKAQRMPAEHSYLKRFIFFFLGGVILLQPQTLALEIAKLTSFNPFEFLISN